VLRWEPPNFEEPASMKRRHIDFAASLALPALIRSFYGAPPTEHAPAHQRAWQPAEAVH